MTAPRQPPADDLAAMSLLDDFVPALQAGLHALTVEHCLPVEGGRAYARSLEFMVQGPRLYLPPGDVHACSPPAGATGDYTYVLPHLVLAKRALPWERELVPDQDTSDTSRLSPWLALMVFSHDEVSRSGAGVSTVSVRDLGIGVTAQADLELTKRVGTGKHAKNWTVFLPELPNQDDDLSASVEVLDVPCGLFKALVPEVAESGGELILLSHVRKVDTGGKVPLPGMPADGEFSVVLCNRFPPNGTCVAHLVSLEGWYELLSATGSRTIADDDLLRLVTLYSWSFVNDAAGVHTFGELAEGLDVGVMGAPEGTLKENVAKLPAAQAAAGARLTRGYRPVDYKPRESPGTFAWYRGPLSPVPAAPLVGAAPFDHADAALVLDRKTGVVDVSYAAAWQLGRLLALAAPGFAKDLLAMRGRYSTDDPWTVSSLEQWIEQKQTAMEEQRRAGTDSGSAEGEAITIVDWLARLALLYPVPFHYLVVDDSLLPPESFRFFHLDSNWLEALLEGSLSIGVHCSLDREEQAGSRKQIRAAVSELMARYRWWLRDQGRGQVTKPTDLGSHDPLLEGGVSGFFMRSELISGWPGIEIEVHTVKEEHGRPTFVQEGGHDAPLLDLGTPVGQPGEETGKPVLDPATGKGVREPELEPATILRWDHVGPGILLCLVKGTLARVKLKEPREHLQMGLDVDELMMRHVTNGTGDSAVGAPVKNKAQEEQKIPDVQRQYERPGLKAGVSLGVLDVNRLVGKLTTAFADLPTPVTYPTTSAAALALQLIRSPEDRALWWIDNAWDAT